jgi:hypothetical protein
MYCEDPGGGGGPVCPRPPVTVEHNDEDGRVPATEHTEEAGHRLPAHNDD